MCGIFGIATDGRSGFTPRLLQATINSLFKLSESRGKEAAGVAIYGSETIQVYKDAISATSLMRSGAYQNLLRETFDTGKRTDHGPQPIAIIGHSRLVTNGAMEVHENNQPVIKSGMAGIHNGIIVNDEQLWDEFATLQRDYEIDTEVLLTLIRKFFQEKGSLPEAFQAVYQMLEGTASVAILFEDLDTLALATNNGSLYTCHANNTHIFASERYILSTLLKRPYLRKLLGAPEIQQLKSGFGRLIDLSSLEKMDFSLAGTAQPATQRPKNNPAHRIVDVVEERQFPKTAVAAPSLVAPTVVPESIYKRFAVNTDAVRALHRCTKCVLPETMPFIEFDVEGVCNYCRSYKPIETLGLDALRTLLDPYRKKNGEPDCLVTFSGGRDSSFGVHIMKSVLNMNPITYTYDWGMVTDLARRNQARMSGQLGLEHILVSADIKRKRENIRKNVTAWLKHPNLGTVPLFMAGDKQYFYYANKLRQQTGVKIVILCENLLETTNFKFGFCGVRPTFGSNHTYTLSISNKARMAFYYGKQYLSNPAYLNGSVIDTLGAFASYYVIPHNYINLFDYVRWEEDKIVPTLIREYDWEVAADTKSTWRIGDGTASFYNYIYYMMAGFSEADTFRSNQIREGMLSRERAIELIYAENEPRFESIQWYCKTIGVDMKDALKQIKSAPKLYSL